MWPVSGWSKNNNAGNVHTMYIEARSRNHCCCGKAISISYSECVSVALVIQHAVRMRRIILWSVAYLALPYFSTLIHKRHGLLEKVIEHKIYIIQRTNKMQLWQYPLLVTARLLYMFRTLSASIIRRTKNCSSSHWSWVGMIYIQ